MVVLARWQPRPDPVGVTAEGRRAVGGRLARQTATERDRRHLGVMGAGVTAVVGAEHRELASHGGSVRRAAGRAVNRTECVAHADLEGAWREPELRDGLGVRAPVGDAVCGTEDLAEVRWLSRGGRRRSATTACPGAARHSGSTGAAACDRRRAPRSASPRRVGCWCRSGCTPDRAVRDRGRRRCHQRYRRRG